MERLSKNCKKFPFLLIPVRSRPRRRPLSFDDEDDDEVDYEDKSAF